MKGHRGKLLRLPVRLDDRRAALLRLEALLRCPTCGRKYDCVCMWWARKGEKE